MLPVRSSPSTAGLTRGALPDSDLAIRWRSARPPAELVHLDSAAAARSSHAVLDAVTAHLGRESRLGGYVAAEAARPAIQAGRAALAGLFGRQPEDLVFVESASAALTALLAAWRLSAGSRVLVGGGEFGPNLTLLASVGVRVEVLPGCDDAGHLDPVALAGRLAEDPPELVHLCAMGSHRGVVQPVRELASVCRAAGVPVVVDAAQALGPVDCRVDADAIYGTSRKWLGGPRGVGFLAVAPELAARLRPARGASSGGADAPVAALESREAFVAGRVGLAVAVAEHLAAGPERIRDRLTEIGAHTRAAIDGVGGWSVVEPWDEPSATTTLRPPTGSGDQRVAQACHDLLTRHRILVTAAGPDRAPREASAATLRVSPHLDVSAGEIDALAAALATC